jgi:hypothetical protein
VMEILAAQAHEYVTACYSAFLLLLPIMIIIRIVIISIMIIIILLLFWWSPLHTIIVINRPLSNLKRYCISS